MKNSSIKTSIILVLIATALWFVGSWWHYSCNIKKTCKSSDTLATNSTQSPVLTAPSTQVTDTDSDGLSDAEELRVGTDPLLKDTDEDGIPDNQEVGVSLDSPLDSDADNIIDALDIDDDNDGITTLIEEKIGTSPLRADTDDDGLIDSIEVGPNTDKPIDTDNDGIINALDTDDDDDGLETISEIELGTNTLLVDSDGDGISDADEIGQLINEPSDTDSDGTIDALDTKENVDQDNDGLDDKLEALLNTDPTKVDSDGDGISDAEEVGSNTLEPLDSDLDGIIDALDTIDDSDTDNDGLTDAQEIKLKSDLNKADSDNDGINDIEEIGKNVDTPLDTDADGIFNIIDKDDDNDKLSTRYEIRIGTNPLSADSDKDGLNDHVEAKAPNSDTLQDTDEDNIINPVDEDDDNDSIPTSVELSLGTNPLKVDSDNDGINDPIEIGNNYEIPLDSNDNGIIDALDPASEVIAKVGTGEEKSSVVNNDISDSSAKIEETITDLELIGEATEGSIQASRFYFPFFSSEPVISDAAKQYFTDIAEWMKQSPDNKITLTGHTDNVGKQRANLALGIKRVMVIREMLIQNGAPFDQIDVISRGESEPIADNKTEQGRLKNRRVEITPLQ